jgi:uncharacterized membrane protein
MLEAIGYVIIGLIMVMLPGYLFSIVLYPGRESLDLWNRVGVSLGLGAMLTVVVGYIIAIPGVSTLSLGSFVAAALILSAIMAILGYLRGGLGVISARVNGAPKIFRRQKPAQEPQAKTPEEPKVTS